MCFLIFYELIFCFSLYMNSYYFESYTTDFNGDSSLYNACVINSTTEEENILRVNVLCKLSRIWNFVFVRNEDVCIVST